MIWIEWVVIVNRSDRYIWNYNQFTNQKCAGGFTSFGLCVWSCWWGRQRWFESSKLLLLVDRIVIIYDLKRPFILYYGNNKDKTMWNDKKVQSYCSISLWQLEHANNGRVHYLGYMPILIETTWIARNIGLLSWNGPLLDGLGPTTSLIGVLRLR